MLLTWEATLPMQRRHWRMVREFSSSKLKEAVPVVLKSRDCLHAVATAVVGKIVPKHGDT